MYVNQSVFWAILHACPKKIYDRIILSAIPVREIARETGIFDAIHGIAIEGIPRNTLARMRNNPNPHPGQPLSVADFRKRAQTIRRQRIGSHRAVPSSDEWQNEARLRAVLNYIAPFVSAAKIAQITQICEDLFIDGPEGHQE